VRYAVCRTSGLNGRITFDCLDCSSVVPHFIRESHALMPTTFDSTRAILGNMRVVSFENNIDRDACMGPFSAGNSLFVLTLVDGTVQFLDLMVPSDLPTSRLLFRLDFEGIHLSLLSPSWARKFTSFKMRIYLRLTKVYINASEL
jgi:hypothetical protein